MINSSTQSKFAEDGVVHLPGILNAAWLAEAEAAWRWSLDNPSEMATPLTPGSSARQDLCNPQALPRYTPLLTDSPLKQVAAELMCSNNVWFMYEQVFHKVESGNPRTPWHQDTSYLSAEGSDLLALWISFEAVPASAALEFVRGSHHGPLYNTTRFDPDDPTLPIFKSDTLASLPNIEANRSEFDIVSFATAPGDVIAFHTSVLHGGGATNHTTPERRTLTLRFFGDNATFAERPGPAGPFYGDIHSHIQPGQPFRHPRFLQVCGLPTAE